LKETLRVGIAQMHSLLGNVDKNLEKHIVYIELARKEKVDLLVFPELSLTGYLLRDIAYEIAEDAEEALNEIVGRAEPMCIVPGLVREARTGIYENSVAYVCGGELHGFYSKLYLPDYGLFEEARYFRAGSVADARVHEWREWRVGSIICEDAWHPEPAELISRRGADVIVIHAASPIRGLYGTGDTPPERVWEAVAVTRAVENASYVVFVNRVGPENEEYFWGGSMVVSPEGEVVARARKMEEDFLVVDLDIHSLRTARRFSSYKLHRGDVHEALAELR